MHAFHIRSPGGSGQSGNASRPWQSFDGMADENSEAPLELSIDGVLDLHTFRPKDLVNGRSVSVVLSGKLKPRDFETDIRMHGQSSANDPCHR
jgi:hypothetical protein